MLGALLVATAPALDARNPVAASAAAATAPAAQPAKDTPSISGPVYYGEPAGAKRIAVVAIRSVYAANPAYIRLRNLGLSESDGGRGQALFDEAQAAARRALAKVAQTHDLQVIAEVGSVQGADDVVDRTSEVIDQLPHFHVEGKVLHGNPRSARELAELDTQAVLMAIPSFVECQSLDEGNARFHILQKDYQERFTAAVRRTARDAGLDVIVESGAATSRFGPVHDVTQQTIDALAD